MEPMFPALAGGFLSTVSLGKNLKCRILRDFFLSCRGWGRAVRGVANVGMKWWGKDPEGHRSLNN